MEIIVICFSV